MNRQIIIRAVVLMIGLALAGCSQPNTDSPDDPPGILEIEMVPVDQVEASEQVTNEIMPVLEALFWGTIEDRRALVQFLTVGCTTADGLGGPPKCAEGEAEGTLVQVFPILGSEGHFARPDNINGTLEFSPEGLYAVYRPLPGVDSAEYWPDGEYALLFERKILNASLPVTVLVQDGKIVRLVFSSYPVEPAELLSSVPLDQILISPDEAKTLTEKIRTPR